jgi:hypothetical protein
MPYIILRGRWCHIVLNAHAPTEDKTDDVKDSFYEELERVFDKFPKYHMKILLDFEAKVGRKDIFKPTIGNERLHEISNDNGVRLVHFATSENLRVKSTMFPHRNIHVNILARLQMGKPTIRLTIFWYIGEGIRIYLMFDSSGQQIVILTTIWWWQKLGRD